MEKQTVKGKILNFRQHTKVYYPPKEGVRRTHNRWKNKSGCRDLHTVLTVLMEIMGKSRGKNCNTGLKVF